MNKLFCIAIWLPMAAWSQIAPVAPIGSGPVTVPVAPMQPAGPVHIEPVAIAPVAYAEDASVNAVAVDPVRSADTVRVEVAEITLLQAAETTVIEPGTLEVGAITAPEMRMGDIFPVDSLAGRAPPSLMRHPRFTLSGANSAEWDNQLGRFDAVILALREQTTTAPVLENAQQYRIVSLHYGIVLGSPENPAVTAYLLTEREAGYNGLIIPYRIDQDPGPAAWLANWAHDHFDLVLIALSAHPPWPTVEDMRGRLDSVLEHADGAVSSWGPSIDLGAVFDPGNEDQPRALTVRRISMWLDEEIAARGKYALGYMYDMVHGTQERPARPGGRAGANYRYVPEGLSAYICANIQPDGTSVAVLGPDALQTRLEPIPDGGAVILGPFIQWRLSDRQRSDRIAAIYHSMGYGVIKKVYTIQ